MKTHLLSFLCCLSVLTGTAQSWTQKADIGGGYREWPVYFSIGSKGYIGMGYDLSGLKSDFWEYDPANDIWTQKADFPGYPRRSATSFSIGSKGYVGLGQGGPTGYLSDLWEYDPKKNTWLQRPDFPGGERWDAAGFSIGNKGYICAGNQHVTGLTLTADLWEFDPATGTWTRKADFGGGYRSASFAFSINGKGYVGAGQGIDAELENSIIEKDLWEYDPTADTWTQKADMPAVGRTYASGFSIGSKGYAGLGYNTGLLSDFWEYDPAADAWEQKENFSGAARIANASFSIGSKGYIGAGVVNEAEQKLKDFWAFTPELPAMTDILVPSPVGPAADYTVSICPGISQDQFLVQTDDDGHTVFAINPNGNDLGATCWEARKVAADDFRGRVTWVGGDTTQPVAYLPRNFLITPTTQPTTVVTIIMVVTTAELNDFVSYFNGQHGTNYTVNDIVIIRYDGPNQDLDLGNNGSVAADYTAISPIISTYGPDGAYTYLEFNTGSFSEFAIGLTASWEALPVKLTTFTAKLADNVIRLNWATAQEQNSAYYDIQRSIDGADFTTIGKVNAAVNSHNITRYSFTDATATSLNARKVYYRLMEVDLDGRSEFSKVALVNLPSRFNISLAPNPVTDNTLRLTIENPLAVKAMISIKDVSGKVLQTMLAPLNKGFSVQTINTIPLSKGLYFMSIEAGDEVKTIKFMKQ